MGGAKTALVTGGNRGIGLEVCRQLAGLGMRVILTARDAKDGARAAKELGVDFEVMDVSQEKSVADCAARLLEKKISVDILVNNAGTYPPGGVLEASSQALREAVDVNFFGAVWTCRAFVPAMLKAGYGRVVNVTSGNGLYSEDLEGPAAYSLSKTALTALTFKLSKELKGDVKANAVCPGGVKTRMGPASATRSVAKGAETIVWLAMLPSSGPSGGVFRDKRPLGW
ncbi:MAG: SDR family NAD(P)-dependent oxidoreductase [Elusimicrobiota bacterium]